MIAVSTTAWWVLGSVAGAAVVLVAALLVFVIIALARRIARQALEIVEALDGARANTDALYDVGVTNYELDRVTRHLVTVRESLERA